MNKLISAILFLCAFAYSDSLIVGSYNAVLKGQVNNMAGGSITNVASITDTNGNSFAPSSYASVSNAATNALQSGSVYTNISSTGMANTKMLMADGVGGWNVVDQVNPTSGMTQAAADLKYVWDADGSAGNTYIVDTTKLFFGKDDYATGVYILGTNVGILGTLSNADTGKDYFTETETAAYLTSIRNMLMYTGLSINLAPYLSGATVLLLPGTTSGSGFAVTVNKPIRIAGICSENVTMPLDVGAKVVSHPSTVITNISSVEITSPNVVLENLEIYGDIHTYGNTNVFLKNLYVHGTIDDGETNYCNMSYVYADCIAGNVGEKDGTNTVTSVPVAGGSYYACVSSTNANMWYSFGGSGLASGDFRNCTAGAFSFGSRGFYTVFTNGAGRATGTFVNCISTSGDAYPYNGRGSFGGQGGLASGMFVNCVGGWHCFGGGQIVAASGAESTEVNGYMTDGSNLSSGFFKHCYGTYACFGCTGVSSGTYIDCHAWIDSFSWAGIASGYYENCSGHQDCFGAQGIASGKFINCRSLIDIDKQADLHNYAFGGGNNIIGGTTPPDAECSGTFIGCTSTGWGGFGGDPSHSTNNITSTALFVGCYADIPSAVSTNNAAGYLDAPGQYVNCYEITNLYQRLDPTDMIFFNQSMKDDYTW